jgi:hypothetical protein
MLYFFSFNKKNKIKNNKIKEYLTKMGSCQCKNIEPKQKLTWKESIQLGCFRNNIPPEVVAIILNYRYGVPNEFGKYNNCAKRYQPNYRPDKDESWAAFLEDLEDLPPGYLGYAKLDYL